MRAARMKAMRERRRARGLRELRLIVTDARSKVVRRRIAKPVARLDRSRESDALGWIESQNLIPDEARGRGDGCGDRRLGKPRPAVIVQTDALPTAHASVVVCQMTFDWSDAPDFRVTIDPNEKNSLRTKFQVIADKPVTIRRERVGQHVGRLDDPDIARQCHSGVCHGSGGLAPTARLAAASSLSNIRFN
jgi:mRNA interferase MazF